MVSCSFFRVSSKALKNWKIQYSEKCEVGFLGLKWQKLAYTQKILEIIKGLLLSSETIFDN